MLPGESSKKAVYRFGPFLLDTSAATLARNGNQLKLQDLPYRLLVILVERHGEIVSREEVRQLLWPQNTFVEFDNSLGVAIRKIRDAIGDSAEAPCYVETIPRRGYRFLAPVTTISESQDPVRPIIPQPVIQPISPPRTENHPAISGLRWRYVAMAAFVVLVIGITAYRFRPRPDGIENKTASQPNLAPVHVRRSVAVMGFRNLPGRPEDNWLSPAFAEMLSTELAADSALRMVSGEDVARAKRELPLADEDSLAKKTLERLHTNPGADVVVSAHILRCREKEKGGFAWTFVCKIPNEARPLSSRLSSETRMICLNLSARQARPCGRAWVRRHFQEKQSRRHEPLCLRSPSRSSYTRRDWSVCGRLIL